MWVADWSARQRCSIGPTGQGKQRGRLVFWGTACFSRNCGNFSKSREVAHARKCGKLSQMTFASGLINTCWRYPGGLSAIYCTQHGKLEPVCHLASMRCMTAGYRRGVLWLWQVRLAVLSIDHKIRCGKLPHRILCPSCISYRQTQMELICV
jgi:hypothetical protein